MTGGPRPSARVAEGKEEKENGPLMGRRREEERKRAGGVFSGPREEKEKGGRGRKRWACWAERGLGKKKGLAFSENDSNTFNLNSNSKEFKFKLNTNNKTM